MDGSVGYILVGVLLAVLIGMIIPPRPTTPAQFHEAEQVCQANGGLEYFSIEDYLVRTRKAVCINGAVFKLPKEIK